MRFFLLALTLFSFISCNKCKKYCQNGECKGGSCNCENWYEGQYCDKEVREKFTGTFQVKRYCNSGMLDLNASIVKDSAQLDRFHIQDFYGTCAAVEAVLTSATEFSIAEQTAGAYTVRGHGSISKNEDTVKVWYAILNGQPLDSCFDFYLRP